MRRTFKQQQGKNALRINGAISVKEVRFIDENGVSQGTMAVDVALGLAQAAGLDLVELVPNAEPPVCKAIDYGKYRYRSQKKVAESRKKQKVVGVKEIRLRPNIDTHDYDVKLRNIMRFLADGDKVKITLRFRGRELSHRQIGFDLLDKVKDDVVDLSKIEFHPKFEGRQITMILAPK